MVISKNVATLLILKIKSLQTIIAIITENKVTEIFCIAVDFCIVFDAQMEKYTIKATPNANIIVNSPCQRQK